MTKEKRDFYHGEACSSTERAKLREEMRGISELQGKGQSSEMRGMRNKCEYWGHKHDLLKGNFVIAQDHPTDIWQSAQTFGKMDLKSSFHSLRVLFTSIKRNFFQKVAFYTNQTNFLGWLFSKRVFWAEKVETNGHLVT